MNCNMLERPVEILVVEDNPADVRLMREGLRDSALESRMNVVVDGVEALNFLQQSDGFSEAPMPDLIVLDLNMPRMDGREVLQRIKSDERLKHIPVVVLSSSESEDDVLRSYQLHASCYASKPVDLDGFMLVLNAIRDFWFKTVHVPGQLT